MPADWQIIPIEASIPAASTAIVGVSAKIDTDGVNAIEIAGKLTAGTKQPILMRKRIITTTPLVYQWQPCFVDKSPNPQENADAAGWFWDRFALPDPAYKTEEFALFNPGGLTFGTAPTEIPRIRSVRM